MTTTSRAKTFLAPAIEPREGSIWRGKAVTLCEDPEQIRKNWDELHADSGASPYQSFNWYMSWLDSIGRDRGYAPFLVCFLDDGDRLLALVPLVKRTVMGIQMLEFGGGSHSNVNVPLAAGDWTPFGEELNIRDLQILVSTLDDTIDVLRLVNIPETWRVRPVGLAKHGARVAPENFFGMDILRTQACLSPRRLKKFRRNCRLLHAAGHVAVIGAKSRAQHSRLIDCFLEQKAVQFAKRGHFNPFSATGTFAFFERLGPNGSSSGSSELRLFGLELNDKIIATMGLLVASDTASIMFMSMTSDAELGKLSPGEILTMKVLELAREMGVSQLDFGLGYASYKERYCKAVIRVRECYAGVSLKGHVFASVYSVMSACKSAIKRRRTVLAIAKWFEARMPARTSQQH